MKKEWFRRNWHWVVFVGVAVISFLVWLGWKHGIAISFAVLSIFVATFFASRSLKLTQDSLELTRATTRAFVTVRETQYKQNIKVVSFDIENTGVLPGENVKFRLDIFTPGEYKNPILTYSSDLPVIFPNQHIFHSLDLKEDLPEIYDKIQRGTELDFKTLISYDTSPIKNCSTTRMSRFKLVKGQYIFDILNEHSDWR